MTCRGKIRDIHEVWMILMILAILQRLGDGHYLTSAPAYQNEISPFASTSLLQVGYVLPLAAVVPGDPWLDSGLVPDVIDAPPKCGLEVQFGPLRVNHGNILTPSQVRGQPMYLSWTAEYGALYTLVFTDPDAPSRKDPNLGEFLHWIVVNMPCCNTYSGQTLADFFRSGPPKGTGLHRYALLLYKQPGRIYFDELRLTNRTFEGRPNFSTRDFANKYGLKLVAGNFYQAAYDPSVDEITNELNK